MLAFLCETLRYLSANSAVKLLNAEIAKHSLRARRSVTTVL